MTQLAFDAVQSRIARDRAIEHVAEAADTEWKERALEAVYRTACRLPEFASDDVWAEGLEKPREPRAMGPVMQSAVRAGYCLPTNRYRPTSNVSQHAQPIRVYLSRVLP